MHISIIFLTFAEGIVGGHVPMTRGNLIHPFPFTKDKIVKEIRYMRKLTQEQFVEKARSIHKGKYGYDRAVYDGHTSIKSGKSPCRLRMQEMQGRENPLHQE